MSRAEEIRYLQSRLEDNPDSVLFARLADRYIELERLDEAIELCRQGIERHPRYATAHLVLAEAYWKKGELGEAEKAVSKALELEPHNTRALHLRAELQRATGWIANAEQDYRAVLSLDPLADRVREELESLRQLEEEVVTPSGPEFVSEDRSATAVEMEREAEPVPEEELADEEVEGVISEIFETEDEETTPVGEGRTPEEELRDIFETEVEEPEQPSVEKEASAATEMREEIKPEPSTEERPPKSEPGPRPSIVTPTLGEIYAAQGQYAKAIGVFQVLKEKEPDNPEWDRKIEMLKKKLAEQEEQKNQAKED